MIFKKKISLLFLFYCCIHSIFGWSNDFHYQNSRQDSSNLEVNVSKNKKQAKGRKSSSMPEPYCSIRDLPFDPQGWFNNGTPMEAWLQAIQPRSVIEVGSWLGSSTRFIAARLPAGAKLYAVDTWLGSKNEELHQQDPRLPSLFQLFLSNVKQAGLTEVIVPIRMESIEASKALNIKADLIYIDASHDTESVYNDIMAWLPHLNPGGVLCGDDWLWPSVRTAVMQAATFLNCSVTSEGNFWALDLLRN